MLIVGLTGGVASGKTAVSQVLKEEGAYIIDADQIARELVQPHKPAWNELIRAFGQEILQEDGSIHRKKLADKVFADPEAEETSEPDSSSSDQGGDGSKRQKRSGKRIPKPSW